MAKQNYYSSVNLLNKIAEIVFTLIHTRYMCFTKLSTQFAVFTTVTTCLLKFDFRSIKRPKSTNDSTADKT